MIVEINFRSGNKLRIICSDISVTHHTETGKLLAYKISGMKPDQMKPLFIDMSEVESVCTLDNKEEIK
jgi:hypothetical protein